MSNDFSWVKPAGEGIANMLGLDPADRARGALMQSQQDKIKGDIELLPIKGEEIKARTGLHKAKTDEVTRKGDSQARLAKALSEAFVVDANGTTSVIPEKMAALAQEFPYLNVDLEKLGKGIAQMNLQAQVRSAGAPRAQAPAKTSKPVQPPAGEITPPPAAGAPLSTAGLNGVAGMPVDLAPGLTTVNDVVRKNEVDGIVASAAPQTPTNTGVVQPQANVAQMIADPGVQMSADEVMRNRLLRAGEGFASRPDFVASAEGAKLQQDRSLADKIAEANAAPFTVSQGQQRYTSDGKLVAESSVPLEVSPGASLMSRNGSVVGTAPGRPVSGKSGSGSGGEGGGGGDGPTTLDVNRSNEWIARAKEVVAEWANASQDFPIDPGTASQLAAHAYRQYFGQGMPNRNADEVMREYLSQSGFKFDTAGNWWPTRNRTEVTTKDGKVITGGAGSPLPNIPVPGSAGSKPIGNARGSGRLANGKDLIPSPDGSTPDKPHALGVGGYPSDPSDPSIKPGTFFRAQSAIDDKYYLFQRQPDGTNLVVDDATSYAAVDGRLSELKNAGFTVFGTDMPKSMRFKEKDGQEKVYKPFEPVNVRHLLAPSTGLAGGVSSWGWVNKIGTFSPLQNMLRYVAKSETGIDGYRAMQSSPTINAYYAEKDPDKQMDILQNWLNNRVAPVREWHQKELEARTAKPATVASTLSDTK